MPRQSYEMLETELDFHTNQLQEGVTHHKRKEERCLAAVPFVSLGKETHICVSVLLHTSVYICSQTLARGLLTPELHINSGPHACMQLQGAS